MSDFSTLALDADSRGLERGVQALDRVVESGQKAADAADKVAGRFDRTGTAATRADRPIRRATDALTGNAAAARRATDGMDRLVGAARRLGVALGAAFSIGALGRAADDWSDMQSVVGAAIGEMQAAPGVMREMVRLANLSYSALDQTVTAFARNSQALRDMGLSTRRQIDFTEALNHSLVITATRGDRAASVQNALSVAMATGRLQGDGLNTVLANGGRVAQSLAEELGVNVSALRGMASEGRITGEVITNALLRSLEDVRREAGEMPATISDGFTRIRTNFTALVGTFDQFTGASGRVAGLLLAVGDNLQLIASFAGAAGVALVATYTPAVVSATIATGAWIASLITLRGALMATGIGALIVAAGFAINFLIDLRKATGSWGEALGLLGDVAKGVWEGIVSTAAAIPTGLSAVWLNLRADFLLMVRDLVGYWASFLRAIGDSAPFEGMRNAISGARTSALEAMGELRVSYVETRLAAVAAQNAWSDATGFEGAREAVQRLRDALASAAETSPDVESALSAINAALGSTASGAGGATTATDALAQSAENWRRRVAEARPATVRFAETMAELDAHLRSGRLSAEEYQGAVAILVDEFANAHPAINTIADAIGDFVASGMRDFRSLLDAFKNMLREMIATAIANPIRIALTTAFMGGGMGGAAQAATGMLGGKGGLLGGGGLLGNLLGSFGTGGSIFGMGGLAGGTGFLGGLGNALSGGFMNIFNIAGNATAGFAGMLGAAIPVIGLVALAFTALLGKTKLLDSGIQVTVDGMDVLVETFRTTQKEYLFGLIKSSPKTATEAMDEKDAAPLIKAVRDMQEAIIEAADILGFGADVFEDFAHVLKISTKDMNEDQAMRAVMEAIEELGDEFADMVPGLEDFVREGEGAMAALTRMAASLTAVQHMVDTLGHAFDEVGLIGGDVASGLVDAFGGLEAMAEATQVYWRAFYTEQERLETMTRQAADALHELGVEMPRSRDEYRALVESLDLTDESTHELYAALLRMAGVMDAILPTVSALTQELMQLQGLVQTGLDGAIRAAQDAAQANARAAADWYRASRSIREWIDRTRGSGSAMASPLQARAANEALYQTTMASAMAGDLEAVGRMTGIADQLMASVRETARSRSDAAVAEARILSDMQLLAGVGDIEGARHDVVAGLLGEQVDVLAEARDYIAAGNALTEDMIDTLQSELRALDDAIEAAQLISYQYLKERLEVTVDILADADVPEYLRTLLGNAERGVTGYIDFILRSDLPPDLRWLALSGASEHVKTIEYLAENNLGAGLTRLALDQVSDLQKTVHLLAGSRLDDDTRRIALAGNSELSRTVNAVLAADINDQARRLALGNVGAYNVVVQAALAPTVSDAVRRIVISQQGSYAAMITAAVDTRMPANERRILLQQQGGYITNISAVLDRDMPGPLRELVLNANTQAARAVTILATTPNLTDVTRTALMAQSGRIDRLIHNAITTGSLNADQRLTLQTVSERVTRTVTGVVNDDRLTSQQRSLLTAITGGSDGRLTLGGSFVFDPSTGFRTWYESQTRNSVQGPMDALRTAMTPLRTALTDLRAAIGAETARARTETERLRQEAAMRELHAYIDRNLVTNSAGSHLVTDEQTNAMARILGISGGGAAKRQAIAAATDVISNLRRDADGSQQERIRQRLANERTSVEELIEAIFDPRRREVPGFATGGMHLGGLRIVGENGPELEATGPARIYSNSQTKAMLGGGNAEVVAELRALRAENAAMRQELAEVKVWTRKTAESTTSTDKTMRKFDTIGIADREDD